MRVKIGTSDFELLSFSGDEEVSVGYDFTVLIVGPKTDNFIHEPISLSFRENICSGIIYYAEFIETTITNQYKYICKFYSSLQHYGKYPICKVYSNITIYELLTLALKSINVEFAIIGDVYKYYSHYYQYNQSVYDLVRYITSTNQMIFYYIGNKLILESKLEDIQYDNHEMYLVPVGPQVQDNIINVLQVIYTNKPTSIEVYNFDIDNPTVNKFAAVENADMQKNIIYSTIEYSKSDEYIKTILNNYPIYKVNTVNSKLHHANIMTINDMTNSSTKKYFIVKISHNFEKFMYSNTCTMVDSYHKYYLKTEIPISTTGPQVATVTGPNHILDSKIRIRFYWDKKGESTIYVPILQPLAGNGWGAIILPRIDQSILILFECNDPNRPFIGGTFYDGAHIQPINTTINPNDILIKSQSTSNDSGHILLLSDHVSNERIEIKSYGQLLCESNDNMNININHNNLQTLIKSGSSNIEIINGDHNIIINHGNMVNNINIGNLSINIVNGICIINAPEINISTKVVKIITDELQFNAENMNFISNNKLVFTGNNILINSNVDLLIESTQNITMLAPKIGLNSKN